MNLHRDFGNIGLWCSEADLARKIVRGFLYILGQFDVVFSGIGGLLGTTGSRLKAVISANNSGEANFTNWPIKSLFPVS